MKVIETALVALVVLLALAALAMPYEATAQSAPTVNLVTTRTMVDGAPVQVHAKEGAMVSVSIETAMPVTIAASDTAFLAETGPGRVAGTVSGSGTSWTVSFTVGPSHAEGPISFWITVHDATTPANTVVVTESDIDGHHVSIDRTRPTMTIRSTSATMTQVMLDEPLSPLVGAMRELDAERWCVIDRANSGRASCAPGLAFDREVTSATVTSTGNTPVITLTHEPVEFLNTLTVVFNHYYTASPFLFTDAALNIPEIPTSEQTRVDVDQRIYASQPAMSDAAIYPFTADLVADHPNVFMKQLLTKSNLRITELTPSEWRIEHGTPSPDDPSNDLALRSSVGSHGLNLQRITFETNAFFLHLVAPTRVPDNDLWITYLGSGPSAIRVPPNGMFLTDQPQFVLNPDARPSRLNIDVEHDLGSGFVPDEGDARASDCIEVRLRLREVAHATTSPTISFNGAPAAAMTHGVNGCAGGTESAGDLDRRNWYATLAVMDDDPTTLNVNEATREGPVEFEIVATFVGGARTTYTESHLTDGHPHTSADEPPLVDLTLPSVRLAKFVSSGAAIHVAFDEPVSHTTLSNLFTVDNAGTPVGTAGIAFDSRLGAYVITLTSAAAAGSTYTLTPITGAITDGAGNEYAGTINVADDTVAPSVTSMTLETLRPDATTGELAVRTGANAGSASLGDTVRVTLELNELTNANMVPTVRFYDQRTPVAMAGTLGGTTWSADLTVTATTTEGPLDLDIVALDYVGNVAMISESDVTDSSSAMVDRTPPMIADPAYSYGSGAMAIMLHFTEALDPDTVQPSTFTVRDSSDTTVTQSGAPTYAPPTSMSPATVSIGITTVADGDYTVEISSALMDTAGNRWAGDRVSVPIDTTGPMITGIVTESMTSTIVTFDEDVQVDGNDAQRSRHWTMLDDDPDDTDGMPAPAVAVTNVETIDDSGASLRLTHATLASSASTPTVAYAPVTADVGAIGAITLGLVTDVSPPLFNRLAAVPAREAADGVQPYASNVRFTGARTIAFDLSEPITGAYFGRTAVSPSLGELSITRSGTAVTLEGSVDAVDGTEYTVSVHGFVVDEACVGVTDACEPNTFSRDAITLTHEDSYSPTTTTPVFATDSLIEFDVSENITNNLSEITISPALAGLAVTRSGLTVSMAFTGTPTVGETYTISIPATVTDTATPPNDLGPTTLSVPYVADTTRPTIIAARTTSSSTVVVTFSEPVIGTTSLSNWELYDIFDINALNDIVTHTGIGTGRSDNTSITIARDTPLRELTLTSEQETSFSRPAVSYRGGTDSLTDRAGNAVSDRSRLAPTDSAPPESRGIIVSSDRMRQTDDLLIFGDEPHRFGSLPVKAGDTVTFRVFIGTLPTFYQGTNQADRNPNPATGTDPLTIDSIQVDPTISFFGDALTYQLTRASGTSEYVYTLTITSDMPEVQVIPRISIADQYGNVASFTQSQHPVACDRHDFPEPNVRNAIDCANSGGDSQNAERYERLWPTVDHTIPTLVSATTMSTTTTLLTFSEKVRLAPVIEDDQLTEAQLAAQRAAQLAAHWTMTANGAGVPVTSAAASTDPDVYTIALTHNTIPTDATPLVSYTRAAPEGRVFDRVEHDLAAVASHPAADGVPPVLLSAVIGAQPSRAVTLTFSEDLDADSVGATTILFEDSDGDTVAGSTIAHDAATPNIVTITFPDATAAPDGMYTVRATTGIADASAANNSPAADQTLPITLNTADPLIVSAVTQISDDDVELLTGYTRNLSQGPSGDQFTYTYDGSDSTRFTLPSTYTSTTTLTFSEDVRAGTHFDGRAADQTDLITHWTVRQGSMDLAISSVATNGNTVTITHATHPGTAVAPVVTHMHGTRVGIIEDTTGARLADGASITATDRVPPVWYARLTSPTTVLITFSEPVMAVAGSNAGAAWRLSSDITGNSERRMETSTYANRNEAERPVTSAVLQGEGENIRSLLLTTGPPSSTSSLHRAFANTDGERAWVKYYPGAYAYQPGAGGGVANTITDLAGNALLPRALLSTDGYSPTLTLSSTTFAGTTLTGTASHALDSSSLNTGTRLALVGPGDIPTRNGALTLNYDAMTRVLTMTFSSLTGGTYRMDTGDIYDTSSVQHPDNSRVGNRLLVASGSETVTSTLVDAPSPRISGAETVTKTTTLVTFDQRVRGTTAPVQWTLTAGQTDIDVRGVGPGTATPAASATDTTPIPEIVTGSAVTQVTLLHDPITSGTTLTLDYNPFAQNAIMTSERLRNLNDAAVLGTGNSDPTVSDGIPPQVDSATFTARNTIELTFEEDLANASTTPPTATYTVTDPSGTGVALSPTNPVSHTSDTRVVTLRLGADATMHGDYAITISGVADRATPANACTQSECVATAARSVQVPALSSLAASVLAGSPLAAKATAADIAAGGETLRVMLTLSGINTSPDATTPDAALLSSIGTPMITFFGGTAAPMTDVTPTGSQAKSVWSADHVVASMPGREGQPEFGITVGYLIDSASFTQTDLTAGTGVIVDTIAPTLSTTAADPLYTRTEAGDATTGLGSARDAHEGDTMLVILTASEALSGVVAADATFSTRPATAAASDHASRMLASALPDNTYVYSRTVAADEPVGPVEFSITIRDAAGNTSTITHDDITVDSDPATGHRLSVDLTAPTVNSIVFTSTAGILITFSEGAYDLPTTLTVSRAPPEDPTLSATLAADTDGNDATAAYTFAAITPYVADDAGYSVSLPGTVRDGAHNAYAAPVGGVAIAESPVSVSSAATTSTTTTAVTFSGSVTAPNASATPAMAATELAARWRVSEMVPGDMQGSTETQERILTGAVIGPDNTIVLTHAPLSSSASTPSVRYIVPAPNDAGFLVDAPTGVFAVPGSVGMGVTATDGTPPAITAGFTSDNVITVRTDEPYDRDTLPSVSNQVIPEHHTLTLAQALPTTLTLTVGIATGAPGGTTVTDGTYAFDITLQDSEANSVTESFSLTRVTSDIIDSARTTSPTTVEVTFAAGTTLVSPGTPLVASHWEVITPNAAAMNPTTITPDSVSALAGGKVTLTLSGSGLVTADGDPDTTATPTVRYTLPDGDSAELRSSVSMDLVMASVEATDGAPPLPLDATASLVDGAQRVIIRLSEQAAFGTTALPGIMDSEISTQLSVLPGGNAPGTAPTAIALDSAGTTVTLTVGTLALNPVASGTVVRYDGALPEAATLIDSQGNRLAGTVDISLIDSIGPSIASAATASATTTEVTFDEPVALVGSSSASSGLWKLKFSSAPAVEQDVDSVEAKSGSPRVLVLTHAGNTHTSSSTATVSYTGTEAAHVADLVSPTPNRAADASDSYVRDGIAPVTTAATTAARTTTVITLDEPVSLTGTDERLSRHWTVTDVDPDGQGGLDAPTVAVTAVSASGSSITITHAELADTASTPTVAYTSLADSDNDGDVDANDASTRILDTAVDASMAAAPNEMGDFTIVSADRMPPTITGEFLTTRSIQLTLSEPISRSSSPSIFLASSWGIVDTGVTTAPNLVTGTSPPPIDYPSTGPEKTITLNLDADASRNRHDVTLPSNIVDRATTPNAYAGSRTLQIPAYDSLTFTAAATAQDMIEVTFTEPVRRVGSATGPLAATAWQVSPTPTHETDPSARIVVTAVSALAANKVTLTLDIDDDVDAQTSTSKTPLVRYVRGASEFEHATTGATLDVNTDAVATDATRPTINSAKTTTTRQLVVQLNEDVNFYGIMEHSRVPSPSNVIDQWRLSHSDGPSGTLTQYTPTGVNLGTDMVTVDFGAEAEWKTNTMPTIRYRSLDDTAGLRDARLIDVNDNLMTAVAYDSDDGVGPVIVSATAVSVTRIQVLLSEAAQFDSADSAYDRGTHWVATVDGRTSVGVDATISTANGVSTVTFTVNPSGAWGGEDTPTVSYRHQLPNLSMNGRVTDTFGNYLPETSGITTTNAAAPEIGQARTVSLGQTEITLTRSSEITAGTPAQIRGHWSMTEPGSTMGSTVPVTISSVRLDGGISHTPGRSVIDVSLSAPPPSGVHSVTAHTTLESLGGTPLASVQTRHLAHSTDPPALVFTHALASPDGASITLYFSDGLDTTTLTPSSISLPGKAALQASQIAHTAGSPTVVITPGTALTTGTHDVLVSSAVASTSGLTLGGDVTRQVYHTPSAPIFESASLSPDGMTLRLHFSEGLDGSTVTPAALSFSAELALVTGDKTRLIIEHDELSGPSSTPTLSYNPATSTAGLITLQGAPASTLDAAPSLQVADGIRPRLVEDPFITDWTHGKLVLEEVTGPTFGNQDAIVLTFDEPLGRDTTIIDKDITICDRGSPVPPRSVSGLVGISYYLNYQCAGQGAEGIRIPFNVPNTLPPLGQNAPPPILQLHVTSFSSPMTSEASISLVPGPIILSDETGVQTTLTLPDHQIRGHLDPTGKILTLKIPESIADVAIFADFSVSGSAGGGSGTSFLFDEAGNAWTPDLTRGHHQVSLYRNTAAPTFEVTVASPRQVHLTYEEPVRIIDGQRLLPQHWRIDTTPSDSTDNTDGDDNWLVPVGLTYELEDYSHPEFVYTGDLGINSRLTVKLTMGTDLSPTSNIDVHLVPTVPNIEDVGGIVEAAPSTVRYRAGGVPAGYDDTPLGLAALTMTVERPTGTPGEFAARGGTFAHYAAAGDRVTIDAVLDPPATAPSYDDNRGLPIGALTPSLTAATQMANMDPGSVPTYTMVIPTSVTDIDGTPFAAEERHTVTYTPSAPTFSNARFESPTTIVLDTSEPLDGATLTTGTEQSPGSVSVGDLGVTDIRRELERVIITTRTNAIPGTSYTVTITDTVTDTDGVAASPTTLDVMYPFVPTATARFVSNDDILVTVSEEIASRHDNLPRALYTLSSADRPSSPTVRSVIYDYPLLLLRIDPDATAGTYEITMPESVTTQAGTVFTEPVTATLHPGSARTPPGPMSVSDVRFFGPEHIQFEVDQLPGLSSLYNIEVLPTGVKSIWRDGLTITMALEGRADRASWTGSWTVPAPDPMTGLPDQGVLAFSIAATDAAGNISDIGPESVPEGQHAVRVDTASPMFSARVMEPMQTAVTFVEQVRGTIEADEWCVDGTAAMGISMAGDTVEFVPSIEIVDNLSVTEGQTFILLHGPRTQDSMPEIRYSPGTPCAP